MSEWDPPALVVMVNNRQDWARVCEEHWYRIPVKHAPQAVAASFLAFYHTKRASDTPWRIGWYAPVIRYRIAERRTLFPEVPQHPRATDLYYVVELEAVVELARPILSPRLRRITFIPTTLGRLLRASEVNDLWVHDDAEAALWAWFGEAGIKAVRNLKIGDGPAAYSADAAIVQGAGGVAVLWRRPIEIPMVAGWTVLWLAPEQIWEWQGEWKQQILRALRGS
ncbi:MAG: hypothetical protein NVS4B8_29520 [Herpetosiphon sp.]